MTEEASNIKDLQETINAISAKGEKALTDVTPANTDQPEDIVKDIANKELVKFETGSINFVAEAELNKFVDSIVAKASNRVMTENTVKEDKDTVKQLNKVKNTLTDRRREVKRSYTQVLKPFEDSIKTMVGKIDNVATPLKQNIDDFEESQRRERANQVLIMAMSMASKYGVNDDDMKNFEVVRKWTNKTATNAEILDGVVGELKQMSEDRKKREHEIAGVKSLAIGSNLDPTKYVQMLEDGKTVGEASEMINRDASIKKQQENSQTAHKRTIDPETGEILDDAPEAHETPQEAPTAMYTISVQCTKEQVEAIKDFINNGLGLFGMVTKD
jgi:hypothetical protein